MEVLRPVSHILLFALCACGRIGFDGLPLQAVDASAGDPDADTVVEEGIPECEWLADNAADLANATPVQGNELSGIVYFSLRCAGEIQRVSLWFEDDTFYRSPDTQHDLPPYDLEGDSGARVAIDTALLHSGAHSVTAWVDYDLDGDGAALRVEKADFQVQHPGAPRLVVSTSPLRENPVALDGMTLSGSVYVSLQPGMRFASEWGDAAFYIDDVFEQNEGELPYDLGGGDDFFGLADPFDLSTLTPGPHIVEARVAVGDTTEIITAAIVVN